MAPEVANKPPLSSKSMASDGIGPRVIRSLWDRLTTWIRPDPADVAPVASFDRSAGSLEVRLNLAVRGGAVPLDRVVLARGRGRADDRMFKLSGRDAELVAPLGRVAHEVTFTTLRITTDSVPSALSLLRVHLATREAASAQAVTIRRAPLESRTYVELTDPDTLVVRDDLAAR